MSAVELFRIEWQELKTKADQLVTETDNLRRQLSSLTEQPAVRQLVEEKRELSTVEIPAWKLKLNFIAIIYRAELIL